MATSAGIYYHLHNVATGKAILAELPEDDVKKIIDEWGLPAQTDRTITDRETLFRELDRVREEGIAFTDEEYVDGLREIGRRVGSVLGAIAIIGPKYRFSSERFTDELPALLKNHVNELEAKIEETTWATIFSGPS